MEALLRVEREILAIAYAQHRAPRIILFIEVLDKCCLIQRADVNHFAKLQTTLSPTSS